MGTKKQVHLFLMGAVSVVLLGLYQQCAPAKFNGFTDPTSKTDGNGIPVDGNGNPIPNSGEIPRPSPTPVATGPKPTPAPAPNPNVPGPVIPGNPNTVARAKCMESLKSGPPLVFEGRRLSGNTGNLAIQTKHLDHVSGNSGNLVIWGIGNSAVIEKLTGNPGNITLCGISVGDLHGNSGNLSITAGSIANISGMSGNVNVTNGNIGDLHGISGNIEIKNGQVTGIVQGNSGNITAK